MLVKLKPINMHSTPAQRLQQGSLAQRYEERWRRRNKHPRALQV